MKRRLNVFFILLFALLVVTGILEWQSRDRRFAPKESLSEVTESVIDREKIIFSGTNPGNIPAILEPTFDTVSVADQYLTDSGLGISLTEGGQETFYPFQILVWHEVVHDELEGKPIVVMYSPLSGASAVFSSSTEAEDFSFEVSGRVYESSSLYQDSRTHSLWSSILGKAVGGALTDIELVRIPVGLSTWGEWKTRHPRGRALSKRTGVTRDYTRSPYPLYDEGRTLMFPVTHRDGRLHPKEIVYGYVGPNGETKAFPRQYLLEHGEITDSVLGRKVEISEERGGILTAFGEDAEGERMSIVLRPMYWFAWFTVFPETELYDPLGEAEARNKERRSQEGTRVDLNDSNVVK